MKTHARVSCLLILSIIVSIVFPIISSSLGVEAQAGLPLISVAAPQIVTAPGTMVFNASVWLESSESIEVSNYQVHMSVDDTILTTEEAWVPTENGSWIFQGENYFAVTPIREDNDDDGLFDAVKLGCTLLFTNGLASVTVTDPVLLGIIKLKVRSTGTTILNISERNPFSLRYHTFIEDERGKEVTIERQDGQVEIGGSTPAEPSTITLSVIPSPALTEQDVIMTGQIIPDKPNVQVKLSQRQQYLGGYLPWVTIATVRTNQTSHYRYVHSFQESSTYQLKASWDGDETHEGAVTMLDVVVGEPAVILEMRYSDKDRRFMGEYGVRVPTEPETMNVTVRNVTDLYQWTIMIYYDPRYVEINEIWLPNDNALDLTGLEYNYTSDLGVDEYGHYLSCEATITETGNGYTGNATLFQFNATGLVVTTGIPGMGSSYTTLSIEEAILENSTGYEIFYGWNQVKVGDTILFEEGVFYIYIAGEFSVEIMIVNPLTGENEFTFDANDTSVGTVFNVTLQVQNAINLYGWQSRLTYNSTLLNATRVIKPEGNTTYVFYNKESNFDHTLEEGSVWINNTLINGEAFEGDGLLAVIEFQILLIATNQTGDLSCTLALDEARVFTGIVWQSVAYEQGEYVMTYGAPSEDGEPEPGWLETYWPYMAGIIVIAAIVAVYMVIRMRRRPEIPP